MKYKNYEKPTIGYLIYPIGLVYHLQQKNNSAQAMVELEFEPKD